MNEKQNVYFVNQERASRFHTRYHRFKITSHFW